MYGTLAAAQDLRLYGYLELRILGAKDYTICNQVLPLNSNHLPRGAQQYSSLRSRCGYIRYE